ncbi:PDR/VanB family oxidoreductase [Falsirhodobacter algicola]|uniref:2Fe-2S iron-sulfur cluster binding domain-containing protein n=1 Tax=Falsirhodobacter algicola TaxID=2692330 RepID=A0A8J8MW09_9RHOB|nr:PDR/VanB family oxidoreductase [Falsirhodobacter algicola]QUS37248.1 2Fe-2S iron-sulfur cluster binding domain-containing protein [Falsirhodobacter algicola]
MNALELRVAAVDPISPLVTRFRFEHPEGATLPPFSGGAHVVVEMPDDGILRRNAYSLISDPLDGRAYEIAVRREDTGRGGSRFMHHRVKAGDMLRVTRPINLFSLDLRARKHVLIGGGIGITPFLAQLAQLTRLQAPFELHYAARTRSEAAGLSLLPDMPQVHVHISDEGNRMDLGAILGHQPLGTHVYTCGPEGLIAAVDDTAARLGWPRGALHSEAFLAPPPGTPFAVTLASGRRIEVGPHESLLEALEAAEVPVDWSCRGGACGRCETRVAACHGRIEHNDHWLTDDEKAAQTKIMPCVSRFAGETLTLDL